MYPVPDHVLERILNDIEESRRLRKLSDEDLVREYLRLTGDQDDELHTNEMCNRLWPQWDHLDLG